MRLGIAGRKIKIANMVEVDCSSAVFPYISADDRSTRLVLQAVSIINTFAGSSGLVSCLVQVQSALTSSPFPRGPPMLGCPPNALRRGDEQHGRLVESHTTASFSNLIDRRDQTFSSTESFVGLVVRIPTVHSGSAKCHPSCSRCWGPTCFGGNWFTHHAR